MLLRSIAISLLIWSVGAIYESDHWTYSTMLTNDNYESFVQDGIEAGKTVFVRFIASEG